MTSAPKDLGAGRKFKRTPCGDIPVDWACVELGKVCQFEYGEGLKSEDREGGKIPVYGSNGIVGHHEESLVKGPGIVVGRKGSIGAVLWSESDFWPIDTTYYVQAESDGVNLKWLYWALIRAKLNRLNSASGVPGLNREDAYREVVPFPPLFEQQKIAEILESVDEAVEKSRTVIEQIKVVKKSLTQQLLTRGIPGRHKRFKKTPIGEIPEEWKVELLGHLTEVGNGTTPDKGNPAFWSGGTVPWIASGKINDRRVRIPTDYITNSALQECPLKLLPAGTILVAMIGQGKTRGMTAVLEIEAVINQNLAYILPCDAFDREFLLTYLEHNYARLRGSGRGSNQDALNCRILKDTAVALPDIEEQKAISHSLSIMEVSLGEAESLLHRVEVLRNGLMAQLLSGRIRWSTSEVPSNA